MQYMHEGSRAFTLMWIPRRGGPSTKYSLRPQVKAYHTCRGHGRPEARDMHVNAIRPEAEGDVHVCMSEAEGRPRPRQA
eukprot:190899-Chlamydomonas_euryale.AAC.5